MFNSNAQKSNRCAQTKPIYHIKHKSVTFLLDRMSWCYFVELCGIKRKIVETEHYSTWLVCCMVFIGTKSQLHHAVPSKVKQSMTKYNSKEMNSEYNTSIIIISGWGNPFRYTLTHTNVRVYICSTHSRMLKTVAEFDNT